MTLPETKPKPEGSNSGPETELEANEQPKAAKVFTQEEVDAIVRERLLRAEDEAKEAHSETDKVKPVATTPKVEESKLVAETGAVDVQAVKAEAVAAAKAALYPSLVAEKIKSAAAGLGFVNAEDAAKMLDPSGFIIDGAISDAKIGEAVGALAKDRPYLLASTRTRASDVGIGSYGTGGAEPVLSGASLMAQVLSKK